MIRKLLLLVLPALLGALVADIPLQQSASADARTLIRFYRLNDKGQEYRVRMVSNAEEPGCHGMKRSAKAHRIMVLGFKWCEVYAESECEKSSMLVPVWDGDRKKKDAMKNPNGRMIQGSRWILSEDDNIMVRSFLCE